MSRGATAAAGLLLTALLAAAAPANALTLSARSAVLVERSTGQRLFSQAADQPRAIASTTKLMTALVTLEQVRHLSRTFTQNDYVAAPADSQIGLAPGERMSVHDLLLALMLPSADDAAEDLAYNVGRGSIGRFVALMNRRARQLGLRRTHYSTPSGLDTPGNHSSASDLVRLADYLLRRSPFIARVVASPRAVLKTGDHVRVVENRNDLVGRYSWINGVKTGHTLQAGYVLVGSATRSGMSLLSAVLGTGSEFSRDQNTLALLRYGFGHFRLVHPLVAGQVIRRPAIRDRPGAHAELLAATGLTRVISRRSRVTLSVQAPRVLTGPLRRGTREGTVRVLLDGRVLARSPLVLAHDVPAVGALTLAARFVTRPPTLVLIVLLSGTGAYLAWRRRERARERVGPVRA